jgi:hypothetical protein
LKRTGAQREATAKKSWQFRLRRSFVTQIGTISASIARSGWH